MFLLFLFFFRQIPGVFFYNGCEVRMLAIRKVTFRKPLISCRIRVLEWAKLRWYRQRRRIHRVRIRRLLKNLDVRFLCIQLVYIYIILEEVLLLAARWVEKS